MADAIGKYGPAQGGSYLSTFLNPFSTMMGSVDRIPSWWMSGFSNTPEGRRAGMLTFKIGANALTAAAAVAAWRAWKHRGKLQDIENDSAAAELGQQLNTTFEPEMAEADPMQKGASMEKKAEPISLGAALLISALTAGGTYAATWGIPKLVNWQNNRLKPGEVPAPGLTNGAGNLAMAIGPLAAAILAGYGTYKYTDKKYNREVENALNKNINIKNKALQKAVLTRAQVARHSVPESYMNNTIGSIEGALATDQGKQRLKRRTPIPYGAEVPEAYMLPEEETHTPFSWDSIRSLPGEIKKDLSDFWKGASYQPMQKEASMDKQAIAGTTAAIMAAIAFLSAGGIGTYQAVNRSKQDSTSWWTRGKSTYATLAGLALLTSWYGAHKYFSATNENNIRFKAFKKGLNEYAKTKTLATPITTLPADAADYFKAIDEGVPAEEAPAETNTGTPVETAPTVQPEIPQSPSIEASKAVMRTAPTVLDDDMNKPISVTI